MGKLIKRAQPHTNAHPEVVDDLTRSLERRNHLVHNFWRRRGTRERSGAQSGQGAAQGGVVSPLLCNVYLHRIDRAWDVRKHGVLVRYADDAVVMCRSRNQARAALERLTDLLAGLGL
ncbi:reverse transcriptase domain-containing protein [Streptomyces sp. NBC_01549]|nr:reverse transcriptase domain-containing protein [Streptomyces sp. NBC_01549]MCX4592162.1 reverse transcriptase domain-containing protein [Streptomyces sp. NBC_01549]